MISLPARSPWGIAKGQKISRETCGLGLSDPTDARDLGLPENQTVWKQSRLLLGTIRIRRIDMGLYQNPGPNSGCSAPLIPVFSEGRRGDPKPHLFGTEKKSVLRTPN